MKIYFLSDAHLGSRAVNNPRAKELRLCNFLESIMDDAQEVYMLGDMFDFWFEYHNVVPKGFTRFLGMLSRMTDRGIRVHYFIGNHDIWTYDYLERECGVILHRHPEIITLEPLEPLNSPETARRAFVAHGDALGDNNAKFLFIRRIFHSSVCQWLFRNVLPADLGVELGLHWAKSNRLKHQKENFAKENLHLDSEGNIVNSFGDVITKAGEDSNDHSSLPFQGEDNEPLIWFAKKYLSNHSNHLNLTDTSDIVPDYFIFGHRHLPLELQLTQKTHLIILGDWINDCTYAVWDGEMLATETFSHYTECPML